MGGKLALTVRFQPEGEEAGLYRKIQEGKVKAGLSAPRYVKKILSEYFDGMEKRGEAEQVLQEIREGYLNMAERVESAIRLSMQENNTALAGGPCRDGGEAPAPGSDGSCQGHARLPDEGGDIPEGALDFLDNF